MNSPALKTKKEAVVLAGPKMKFSLAWMASCSTGVGQYIRSSGFISSELRALSSFVLHGGIPRGAELLRTQLLKSLREHHNHIDGLVSLPPRWRPRRRDSTCCEDCHAPVANHTLRRKTSYDTRDAVSRTPDTGAAQRRDSLFLLKKLTLW